MHEVSKNGAARLVGLLADRVIFHPVERETQARRGEQHEA